VRTLVTKFDGFIGKGDWVRGLGVFDDNLGIGQLKMLPQGVEVVRFGLLAFGDDEKCLAG
jgi:hypothetical protein